ncbi:hypothetical protein [Streptomyces tateyamensis]|nr:hypothetical protein [Streptomyces tateyamensis]
MTAQSHGASVLGEFRSSRRAQLTPAAVGLRDYGDPSSSGPAALAPS